MSLIVTGASGQLGRLAVAALLDRVPPGEVVLVSRTPAALADFERQGATVRFGDFEQPASLPAAFAGGERALVISTLGARDTVVAHRAAFEAAARAGVGHIVYTSVQNPVAGNPWPPAQPQRLSEEALRAAGVPWTMLRNALYADLRAQLIPAYLRDGRWTTNIGAGAHAYVARADCAAAAVAALTTDGHAGREYDITGPELIGAPQFLALLAELGGRPVTCAAVDDDAYEAYRAAFMADPANAGCFELFTGSGAAIRTGYLGQLGTGVQQLTGRAPATLAQVARRCRENAGG
ncbi:MAG TPA: NAD(P)H-binding protein [Streptosporangiaceae bacterium]|nr:NAD(P)H-binding protein [Streptosporangiaceae bacterium]